MTQFAEELQDLFEKHTGQDLSEAEVQAVERFALLLVSDDTALSRFNIIVYDESRRVYDQGRR